MKWEHEMIEECHKLILEDLGWVLDSLQDSNFRGICPELLHHTVYIHRI